MKKFVFFLFLAVTIFKTSNSFSQVAVNKLDSMALVNLYDSAGGKNWYHNTNWLAGPVSTWYDVTVTGTRVTSLSLYFNNLIGVLPYTLGNLTALQTLELSKNELSGAVPSSLGDLSAATTFDLSFNSLTDSVPATLNDLTAVTYFDLSHNQFTFSGLETLVKTFRGINFAYGSQADIPLDRNLNKLSVFAGGTLANNTYSWYNGTTLVASKVGDSTYLMTSTGSYSVTITNAVVTGLTLYSDTLVVSALPVSLVTFTATKESNQNILKWSTAAEVNSSYFSVERSSNNNNFIEIGSVNAQGNSTAETVYSFTDSKPNNGTNNYRLRIVDKDGQFIYSEIKSLTNSLNITASIYPNPVQSNLNLNFSNATATNAQVEIVNAEGKIMLSKQIQLTEGASIQTFNTSSLSNGTYYLRLITPDGETGLQFVKIR